MKYLMTRIFATPCVMLFSLAAVLAWGLVSDVRAAVVPASDLASGLHWRNIGPFTGGRVTSVAGIASEPEHFYAAFAGSGVWETEDNGTHWQPISDRDFRTSSVGAIAVAPSNPRVIYAGTGDSAPRNTALTTGDGMYKSTDGGKTWAHIGLEKTHVISWIVVDPRNADVVYAAALGHVWAPNAERGVYKSTDGGSSWTKVLFVNADTGAITMAMDPANPNVVYATMWNFERRPWTFHSGGPGGGIYKTTDGGSHWSNISHHKGLPEGVFGKAGVAVAPSSPNTVYALIEADYKGRPGGLFRSTDGGDSWTWMNSDPEILQRAFYYMRVFVDPRDANTIYLPNVDFYVSRDGGKTLSRIWTPHGDNHALWINPSNTQVMVQGDDGGASVSTNGGKSWSTKDNQPTGQFYHTNLDEQFPFHVYGSQQDRGSVESASAVPFGGIPGVWKDLQGHEASWVVPTPGEPWIYYTARETGRIWRTDEKTGSALNISPWPAWKFGLAAKELKYRYAWIYRAMGFYTTRKSSPLLVGAQKLLSTSDGGESWTELSPDLTRNDKTKQQRPGGPISADVAGQEVFDTISTIGVSASSEKLIWVGTDDGVVSVTTDGGEHWSQVTPKGLPTWTTITDIEPSHSAPGTAYMSASRYMWDDFQPYLFKTTDYGKHWSTITRGIPGNEYMRTVRQDPDAPNILFAGSSKTVYMSLDDGANWFSLRANLPVVEITNIQIQKAQHAVVISTFGRGFWVLDDLKFLEQLSSAQVATDASFLFKPQQTWLVKRVANSPYAVTRTGNAGENLAAGAKVLFYLPADYDGKTPVTIGFSTGDGKAIRSFELPIKPAADPDADASAAKPSEKLHAGLNQFLWDMRYPEVADVKGIRYTPFAASRPVGPEIVPGRYEVQLAYGGHTQRQGFEVRLDPRLSASQAQLQQRFDLLMRIQVGMGELAKTLNAAIDARKALGDSRAGHVAAQALDRDIAQYVNLKIQSSEGGLVFAPRLRSQLSFITDGVDEQYAAPTSAMVKVTDMYLGEVGAAVKVLQADVAQARSVQVR